MSLKKRLLSSLIPIFFVSPGLYAATISDMEDAIILSEEAIADLQNAQEYALDVSGYADIEFSRVDNGDPMGFRMHHLSLFFQKKISQKWRFFSEIEFEDALKHDFDDVASGTAWGKLFVEAVNFDYSWRPEAKLRVGRFFTPAGIWSIDHYPPFVSTQERPAHIRNIFPQTTDGAMLYGTLRFGAIFLTYDAYASNGEGNTGKADSNNDKAFGAKLNISLPVAGLKQFDLGGSVYFDPDDSAHNRQRKQAMGAHAKIRAYDFILQAEGAASKFSTDAGSALPNQLGYYAQLSYAPNDFSLGYRYDIYDEDTSGDGLNTTNTVFTNYRATSNLVLKLEHHLIDKSGDKEQKTIVSIAAYLD